MTIILFIAYIFLGQCMVSYSNQQDKPTVVVIHQIPTNTDPDIRDIHITIEYMPKYTVIDSSNVLSDRDVYVKEEEYFTV